MLLPRVSGGRCLENIVTTCEVGSENNNTNKERILKEKCEFCLQMKV